MPNNGTKIYTETIGTVKYGIDLAADVYKVLGVSPTQTGGAYCDRVCANKHGKINKDAKYKPYRIDTFQDPTEEQRKAINYGLSQASVDFNIQKDPTESSVRAPWGQWEPPRPNIDWHRPTDFDGYNHKAVPYVKSLKIYSSAGEDKTKPILKNSSYPNKRAWLRAELELESSINAEIKFSDLCVDSGNTELGELYLTLFVIARDGGSDSFHFAAQSPNKIKDENVKAIVEMETTKFPNPSQLQNEQNLVIVCLSEKLTINADHTYSGNVVPSGHWSADINGADYQCVILNPKFAVYGDGQDGGQPTYTDVNIYGRFNADPLPFTSIQTYDDGTATLTLKGEAANLVTWTGIEPTGFNRPNDIELLVDLMLTPVSGAGQPQVFTYHTDFDSINDTAAVIIDDHVFPIDTIDLQGRGQFTAKLTYRVDVKRQSGELIYHFYDADDHSKTLQKVVNLSNVTFY